MDRRTVLKGVAAWLTCAHFDPPATAADHEPPGQGALYDLGVPEHAMDALVKMRADLRGAESSWYWTGTVWSMVPGEGNRRLFDYNGFSAARFEKIEDGYRMLNREIGVYRDIATGEILKRWLNPHLGREVQVMHRLNDHVNAELLTHGRFGIAGIPTTIMGDDVWWRLDLFFFRPSPISREEYPLNVQHDMYQGAELTMYHARLSDIQDTKRTSVPADVSFSRISQWEPFMEMGNRPGHLVFHTAGKKLMAGPEELASVNPSFFRHIADHHPAYLRAPEKWQPGTVSQWEAFRRLKEGP